MVNAAELVFDVAAVLVADTLQVHLVRPLVVRHQIRISAVLAGFLNEFKNFSVGTLKLMKISMFY